MEVISKKQMQMSYPMTAIVGPELIPFIKPLAAWKRSGAGAGLMKTTKDVMADSPWITDPS
jgi:hypothetical protein